MTGGQPDLVHETKFANPSDTENRRNTKWLMDFENNPWNSTWDLFFVKIGAQTQGQWRALAKLLYTLFLGTGNQAGSLYAIWPGQNTVSNLHSQGLSNPRSIAKALCAPLMKMKEFIPVNTEIHTRWWVILAAHVWLLLSVEPETVYVKV